VFCASGTNRLCSLSTDILEYANRLHEKELEYTQQPAPEIADQSLPLAPELSPLGLAAFLALAHPEENCWVVTPPHHGNTDSSWAPAWGKTEKSAGWRTYINVKPLQPELRRISSLPCQARSFKPIQTND
jgi:hypothetical protein